MKTKRLFYEEENGEFYWITETDKTLKIEWVAKFNCDSEKTPLDQNVDYKELKVGKEKNRRHCLSLNEPDTKCVYPDQNGKPFYLEIATMTHITSEIATCVQWGVSSQYYQDLIPLLSSLDKEKNQRIENI